MSAISNSHYRETLEGVTFTTPNQNPVDSVDYQFSGVVIIRNNPPPVEDIARAPMVSIGASYAHQEVIFKNARGVVPFTVGWGAIIENNAALCNNACVGKNVCVAPDCVIGAHALIGDGAEITGNVADFSVIAAGMRNVCMSVVIRRHNTVTDTLNRLTIHTSTEGVIIVCGNDPARSSRYRPGKPLTPMVRTFLSLHDSSAKSLERTIEQAGTLLANMQQPQNT